MIFCQKLFIHSYAMQWHVINTEIKCNPNPKPDGYCLVLASIRDEFLMRPSRECHFWDQNPDIVGGMDYEEGRQGGTWLAMHRNGKITALLNVLKPLDQVVECEKTRGFLTVDYLNNNFDGPTYFRKISSQDLNQFNGFIIVTIDIDLTNHRITTAYLTNLEKQLGPTVAEEGIFTFGNSLPGRPWRKVNNAKRMFKKILLKTPSIKQKDFLVENLFKMMLNNKEYFPDDQLLKDGNGLNEKYLRKLSSLYVKIPDILFGSRTHTVILVDSKGNVDYIEKTMQEPTVKEFKRNNTWINTRLRFNLNGHHHPATIIPVSRL